jgi:hypothetical protein
MAEDSDNKTTFTWPLMTILAAIGGGALFWHGPLKSSRPAGDILQTTSSMTDQTCEARLWQDPVKATEPGSGRQPGGHGGEIPDLPINNFEEQLKDLHLTNSDGRSSILVLGVMIPGGRYVEDAERRTRSRYAVISALLTTGYDPEDEEHLGVFTATWQKGASIEKWSDNIPSLLTDGCATAPPEDGNPNELRMPFEWFKPSSLTPPQETINYAAVLVCWLCDNEFVDHPLPRLAQLLTAFRDAAPKSVREQLCFKLIDPRLDTMQFTNPYANWNVIRKVKGGEDTNSTLPNALKGLEMYSSWTTRPDIILWPGAKGRRREAISNAFQTNFGIVFHNITCTDDELATNLTGELALRGIHLSPGGDSVALIAERDTFYGRSLPLIFAAALDEKEQRTTSFTNSLRKVEEHWPHNWPTNCYRFSYLRGIDGLLPGESTKKSDQMEKGDSAKEQSRTERFDEMERPEGRSQLDYMPRLAHELKDFEREITNDLPHKPLRAIGVVGSDVYDKLLLLQSLQKQFPDAIFFSTDLDARLFHPSELDWSRNLIVASSFGLELGEALQRDVAPFRDVYQTGTYLASLAALGNPTALANLPNVRPQIFEIGRHGAYALSVEEKENCLYRARPYFFEKHPRPMSLWGIGTIFVVIVCYLLYWKSKVCGGLSALSSPPLFGVAAALVIVWGALVYAIWWQHGLTDGAPFSLTDGVSIWPCELMRAAGLTLAVILVARGLDRIKTSNDRLEDEFRLVQGGTSPVEDLWFDHVTSGELWPRFKRTAPLALLYALFAIFLFWEFGLPTRPIRGDWSKRVDLFMLGLSAGALICLMFFVLDTAIRTRELVSGLSQRANGWPPNTVSSLVSNGGAAAMEWITIRFIAKRTAIIDGFIYYPFIVLLVMVVARTSFFGRFGWPAPLILVLGLNALIVVALAISVHRAAQVARGAALERLEAMFLASKFAGAGAGPPASAIKAIIKQVEAEDDGAFGPWSQQPFIRAVLVPLSGGGLMAALQALLQ